jgi:protein-S-isoprenylcysteine O-methyltransferase Ste14
VTRGLFALTRNPIYLGMLLILTTIPLMAAQPRLLIFTLVFFLIMDFYVIPREERIIRAGFGVNFDDYRKRTRRWLGTYKN